VTASRAAFAAAAVVALAAGLTYVVQRAMGDGTGPAVVTNAPVGVTVAANPTAGVSAPPDGSARGPVGAIAPGSASAASPSGTRAASAVAFRVEAIEETLKSYVDDVSRCRVHAVGAARVSIELAIAPDGHVDHCRVLEPVAGQLGECIATRAAHWKFPRSVAGTYRIALALE
jgi:hypothetical protein